VLYQLLARHNHALELEWEKLEEVLTGEQLSTRPVAGSHPHEVRKWLLAYSFFPAKWINQIFSVGGIGWEESRLQLLAYKSRGSSEHKQGKEIGVGDRQRAPVTILFEDDHCLIANKPSGLPVHQSYAGQVHTLDALIERYMDDCHDPILVRHIHRIDDDTSGPVLYAKHDLAQYLFDEAMREKRIDRQYLAIVEGTLSQQAGVVNAPIGKHRHQPKRRVVTADGDNAMTHYKLMEGLSHHSVVELTLETGRTHQIRVHMSHIGHPLVGDKLYGGSTKYLSHQALHGVRLRFVHPFTEQELSIEAPLPQWYEEIKRINSK